MWFSRQPWWQAWSFGFGKNLTRKNEYQYATNGRSLRRANALRSAIAHS